MIAIIPIEPISNAHGMLIVEAFNRFFIDRGGLCDNETCGWGYGDGDGVGDGFDEYYGDGQGGGGGAAQQPLAGPAPEEWRVQ